MNILHNESCTSRVADYLDTLPIGTQFTSSSVAQALGESHSNVAASLTIIRRKHQSVEVVGKIPGRNGCLVNKIIGRCNHEGHKRPEPHTRVVTGRVSKKAGNFASMYGDDLKLPPAKTEILPDLVDTEDFDYRAAIDQVLDLLSKFERLAAENRRLRKLLSGE